MGITSVYPVKKITRNLMRLNSWVCFSAHTGTSFPRKKLLSYPDPMLLSGVWGKNMQCASCILPVCRWHSRRVVDMDLETMMYCLRPCIAGWKSKQVYLQQKEIRALPVLSVGGFTVGQDNGIPKHFKVLRLQYKGDYRFGFPLHEYINQGCKYIIRATTISAVTLCTVHTTCYCIQVI